MKLLSYLYQEALDNCSNEHYPVLLSLLKTSCEPYTRWGRASRLRGRGGGGATQSAAVEGQDRWAWTAAPPLPGRSSLPCGRHAQLTYPFPHTRRFIHDWVYSGVFRDVYGEFMIQVNHEYLGFRGRWGLLPGGDAAIASVRAALVAGLSELSHTQTGSTGPTATCLFPKRRRTASLCSSATSPTTCTSAGRPSTC